MQMGENYYISSERAKTETAIEEVLQNLNDSSKNKKEREKYCEVSEQLFWTITLMQIVSRPVKKY